MSLRNILGNVVECFEGFVRQCEFSVISLMFNYVTLPFLTPKIFSRRQKYLQEKEVQTTIEDDDVIVVV